MNIFKMYWIKIEHNIIEYVCINDQSASGLIILWYKQNLHGSSEQKQEHIQSKECLLLINI